MNRILGNLGLVMLALYLSLSGCGKPAAETQAGGNAARPVVKTVAFARTPSPPGARVFFITPNDGESVSNPFRIAFGIEGMSVVKAGSNQPESGHHHLLIDTGLPDPALPVPADANHKHFGDGSTSTEISLEPGQHSLQLLLADHLHIPHDPPVASDVITVTVE